VQVLLNIGEMPLLRRSRFLALFVKPLLDALVLVNRLYLRTHHVPPLYRSGVRYKQEPDDGTPEEFAAIPEVLRRGWGDCDDLAPWRVAELQEAGERARVRITWRRRGNGRRLYHVVVRRGDGRVEDPSRLLGM
jgi:hypothetical protein